MPEPFHTLQAEGIRVTLDLRVGHVRTLVVTREGRDIAPFHTAPWVDDPAITGDESLPGNLRYLSGDFFCAPFCTNDVVEGPPHGWPANSPWRLVEEGEIDGGRTALYRLERPVMGARLDKRFTLRHGHPFLYETHTFTGGEGALPVANHAMLRLPDGGRLAFSAKASIETPAIPLETDPAVGRSLLRYPAHGTDPTRVPLADGGTTDLTRFPIAERHDDFVMLVEARDNPIGWFAASRMVTRDAVLSLKNPADFPVTFLWFSNGGRDYVPWSGRHAGVLGIEEGRAIGVAGHAAALAPNPLSEAGIPTTLALRPGGTVSVRNVVGAVALGGSAIVGLTPEGEALACDCEDGSRLVVPYDAAFLTRGDEVA